jgi:hypothetical protein
MSKSKKKAKMSYISERIEYIPTLFFDGIPGSLTLEDVEVIFDKSLSNGDACG